VQLCLHIDFVTNYAASSSAAISLINVVKPPKSNVNQYARDDAASTFRTPSTDVLYASSYGASEKEEE
jgi:hypothetical protein